MNESQFLAATELEQTLPKVIALRKEKKEGRLEQNYPWQNERRRRRYSERIKGESDIPLDESQFIFNPVNEEKARQEEMKELAALKDESKKDERENLNRYDLNY